LCDGFQAHVAACDGPLVVLLKHQRADEPNDGVVVGEDANDIRAPLDLLVQSLARRLATFNYTWLRQSDAVKAGFRVQFGGPSGPVAPGVYMPVKAPLLR